MSNIVGVKYIGSKQRKEDNVLNSGVTWAQGQVINFNIEAANKLAVYADVWVITDVDHDAVTKVVGDIKPNSRKHEPATFVDVNSMDKDALHAFARTTLLRQLPEMELDALRDTVKSELVKSFLDDQEETAKEGMKLIALEVTEAEYEAYANGVLELKLVPVADKSTPETPVNEQNAEGETTGEQNGQAESTQDANSGEENQGSEPVKEPPKEGEETLEQQLAKLDKVALREMCKELGISYSNTMTEDKFRERILAKAAGK